LNTLNKYPLLSAILDDISFLNKSFMIRPETQTCNFSLNLEANGSGVIKSLNIAFQEQRRVLLGF